jgi:exodeoxyribonuclease III
VRSELAGPSPTRAGRLVDWLASTQCNVLVLTEVHSSDAGKRIISGLRASGFDISCPEDWVESRHFTIVASKGFAVSDLPAAFDLRITAADLSSRAGTVRIVGIYGPTNGLTAESSAVRSKFQRSCLDYLEAVRTSRLIVAGDLNVIEPGHKPPLPDFAPHDYAFYSGIIELGMCDAYRRHQPDGADHSWVSGRFGAQRLDHVFLAAGVGDLADCRYDHAPRIDGLSDHSALIATVDFAAA